MASLGLLQGLGRGISQGSQMLAQGMSEDREVERQRMREASIEKRWQRQQDKEDTRYADNIKFRESEVKRQEAQDAKADGRYSEETKYRAGKDAEALKLNERQMSLSEQNAADRKELAQKERIEQTLGRLEKEAEREGTAIDRRFDRQIDIAKANNANAEEIKKIHDERDTALQGVNAKLTAKMLPALKSFGNELQGTAYASYYDQILAEQESLAERQGQQFLTDAGVVGADGNFTNTASPKPNGRIGFVYEARGGAAPNNPAPTQAPTTAVKPGFVAGLNNGVSGFINPSEAVNASDSAPIDKMLHGVGTGIGLFAGLPGDAAQIAGAGAKTTIQPIWTALTAKPSELETEKAKLLQQKFGGGLFSRAGQYKK